MSRSLKISVLLNICLAALALWLGRQRRMNGVNTSDSLAAAIEHGGAIPIQQPAPKPVAERVVQPRQQPFQWSQIESSDYRTYVANLRAVGCPEQTIRDIITADVDSVYAPKRAQLHQEQAGQPGQGALQIKLQQLQSEEVGVLAALLGQDSPPQKAVDFSSSNSVTSEVPKRPSRFSNLPANTSSVPIVFQDPGRDVELDTEQIAVINELRADFNNELKGLDPTSVEYRQRWQEARSTADQRMCALLGYSVWLDYLTQARNQHQAAPVTGQ